MEQSSGYASKAPSHLRPTGFLWQFPGTPLEDLTAVRLTDASGLALWTIEMPTFAGELSISSIGPGGSPSEPVRLLNE